MKSTSSKSQRTKNYSAAFRKVLEDEDILWKQDGEESEKRASCAVSGESPYQAAHIYATGGNTRELREAEFAVQGFRDNHGNIMDSLFHIRNGLLLRHDLHYALDQHKWCIDVSVCMRYILYIFISL